MEMLLMGLCVAMFGVAVACAAFSAATRADQQPAAAQPEQKQVVVPVATQFFTDSPIPALPARRVRSRQEQVSLAALLAQIENHIRLEQAAAESFVESPTPTVLQTKTTSTFIN
jgi:hypothetical protein